MINYFIFDGHNSRDYGVYISGANTFNAPQRNVKKVQVAGRNGDLTIDEGTYENISLKYPAFIFNEFNERVAAFRNLVLSKKGYKRLEDTYHPDEYRMARYSGGFEADVISELYAGEFNITFDCMPQRFLKSGEEFINVSNGDVIRNKTLQIAKPLIECTGNGTIEINGISIVVSGVSDYIDIDCDLQEAYKGDLSTPLNDKITLTDGAFFELPEGENEIHYTGFSDVKIKPRWWIV